MIQKLNPHNTNTPPGPEVWGTWGPPTPFGRKCVLERVSRYARAELGTRYYSLEVVQNPVRARMCGFGDKVRLAGCLA